MHSTKQKSTKVPYPVANDIARRMRRMLAPSCVQIEVAGSVRRQATFVSDIEIIAVPIRQQNLFGDAGAGESLLDDELRRLIDAGVLAPGPRNGEKWKTLTIVPQPGSAFPSMNLDLFIADPATWGFELIVRTGPANFSRDMVTPRNKGGKMPDGWKIDKGWRVHIPGNDEHEPRVVECRTELEVFTLYGMRYIEPWARI